MKYHHSSQLFLIENSFRTFPLSILVTITLKFLFGQSHLKTCFPELGILLSDQIRSVAQSCPTLRPHESPHTRPPCPSPTPGVHSDSRPWSQWCHPAISSSVVPFSSCPNPSQHQSLISNESTLHMRWPKYWSFSFSIIPSKEIPGLISFRMDWLDLLGSPRDSQESFPTPQFKSINSSALSLLHSPTLTSIHDNQT